MSAPRLVIDMRDRRPIWAMPDWSVDEIRQALPPEWEVTVIESFADGSGDGSSAVREEVLDAVEGSRVYFGFGVPAEVLRRGRGLTWVHSGAAGVGSSLTPEMLESEVLFTNSAGIHGPPMAEMVMAMILYFSRGLDLAIAGMKERRWASESYCALPAQVSEVAGSTVGILGLGGVGNEVAVRAQALGAKVLGYRRGTNRSKMTTSNSAMPRADCRTETLFGEQGFERVLTESDHLVLTLPDTAETRGLIDSAAIRRTKPGAVLLNVARGSLVDEKALLEALRHGHLRGVALDVFSREPLPDDHPLWELPNVLITPHISAVSEGFWRRETDLILENVKRFLAGEPLLNFVDKIAGY